MVESLPAAPGVTSAAVHAFLSDELVLAFDPSAWVGQARTSVTRLSAGLAIWARRLEFEPFKLRVVGTAGSGKTQLALRLLEDAVAKGLRAQYVCFNRPLADHLARVAPAAAKVATFHMLGDQRLRAQGQPPDFRELDVFDRLADAFIDTTPLPDDLVDVLVVDEGQDFSQAWADALLAYLKPDGIVGGTQPGVQRGCIVKMGDS
jgi:hypothetical protein